MKTKKLTTIGLCTAVICILGPIALPLPFSPVPVSLGTLGILLACTLLGPGPGLLCTGLYLLLGLAGLPVFTGFTGGIGKILGPTGGYMIGYLLLALIGGYLYRKGKNHPLLQFLALFAGMLFCYLFGTLWLTFQAGLQFQAALWAGVIPYIPFDLAKIAAAQFLTKALKKRLIHTL